MNLKIKNYLYCLMATCAITCQLLAMETQKKDKPSVESSQPIAPNINTTPQTLSNIQFKVGLSYYEGKNIPQNCNEAFKYFKLSAEQGHPLASFYLAHMYRSGVAVPMNKKMSFNFFKFSAEQGNIDGQCDLGACYYNGYGVSQDYTRAVYYYKLAAEQGHQTAQLNLGILYTQGKAVEKDIYQATRYFTMAADQGNSSAQYNLGLCHHYGQGVTQDLNQAILYYKQAAEQGHLEAQASLLKLHKEGFYNPCDLPNESSPKQESSESISTPSSKLTNTNKKERKNKKTSKNQQPHSKEERQKNLFKEVMVLLDVNPQGALTLLREAEKDGCPDSKNYLSKLRKSKSYRNNLKNNPKSLGSILRSMESSNNESSPLHKTQHDIPPQESLSKTEEKIKTKTPVFATHNNSNSLNQMSSPIEETKTPINKENNSETKEEKNSLLVSGEGPSQEALTNALNTKTIQKIKTPSHSRRTLKRSNSENNLVPTKEKTKERRELKRSLTITDKHRQTEDKKEEKSDEKCITIKEKKNKKNFRNNANPTRELKKMKSEKKLERKNSQLNLIFNNEAESETEQSAAEAEPKNLYIQEGTRDTDLKRLKKLLNNRDLIVASDIKLTESLVRRVLRELSDKKVISWNFEKDKVKGDKITATHCQNQNISLTIHLHGMWWTRTDVKEGILDFLRRCDSAINKMILEIETKKSQKQF